MGERKGVNKYYPPDWTPAMGSLNKYHGTHALRERARKLVSQGILIIRFEMPYNIWCEGCQNHIGMGVRYNAEKKKIGMYYTTPVYQFRMKCHLCNNHFEIKTDPQNLDYVIVSGARRQERRWDPTQNEQVVPEDKDTSQKLVTDAMFKLEHGVDDQKKRSSVAPSLARLEDRQMRWKDHYVANKVLRSQFREKKHELVRQSEADRMLLAKSSLDIPLVPENQQDVRLASLLRLTPLESFEDAQKRKRDEIVNSSIFENKETPVLGALGKIVKDLKLQVAVKDKTADTLGIIPKGKVSTDASDKLCTTVSTSADGTSLTVSVPSGLVSYSDGTSESDENS